MILKHAAGIMQIILAMPAVYYRAGREVANDRLLDRNSPAIT